MTAWKLMIRLGAHSGSVLGTSRLTSLFPCSVSSTPANVAPLLQFSSMVNDSKVCLRFVRLSDRAHAPVKGSAKAAGFDLKSAYDYIIPAHGKEIVKTDLQVQLPEGCYGRVAPRSGLAAKNFIDVGAGVIDEDYRGNIGVVLFNHSDNDFEVKSGDRVAQLICERIFYPTLVEEKLLEETARGEGGFGSTGTN